MWICAIFSSHVADYIRTKGIWSTTKTRKIMNLIGKKIKFKFSLISSCSLNTRFNEFQTSNFNKHVMYYHFLSECIDNKKSEKLAMREYEFVK